MPPSEPSIISGSRSMASPMTPPRPLGSGQRGLAGRQEARPAAKTEPTSQNARRIHSRSNGRWVAMRQPHTATGSTNTVAASPNNCISRSAPTAPGVPRKLRTGPSVAWLSDGSWTDHVPSATAISADSVIRATPPPSETRRRIRSRRSSDQPEKSMPWSMEAMLSVQSLSPFFLEHDLVPIPVPTVRDHAPGSTKHLNEAMQRLGRDVLVLNERNADVAVAGIAAVSAVARKIMTGNDAQAALAPEFDGGRLVAAV